MWAAVQAMKAPNRAALILTFLVAFPALAWGLAAWGEASHGFSFVSAFIDVIFVELLLAGFIMHGIVENFEQRHGHGHGDDLRVS